MVIKVPVVPSMSLLTQKHFENVKEQLISYIMKYLVMPKNLKILWYLLNTYITRGLRVTLVTLLRLVILLFPLWGVSTL